MLASSATAEELLVQFATSAKILGHALKHGQQTEFYNCNQKQVSMAVGDRIEATINTCPSGGVFKISGAYTSLSPLFNAQVLDASGKPYGQIEALTIPDKPELGIVNLDIRSAFGDTSQATISAREFDAWTGGGASTTLLLDSNTGVLVRGPGG